MEIYLIILLFIFGISLGGFASYLWRKRQTKLPTTETQLENFSNKIMHSINQANIDTLMKTTDHLRQQHQTDLQQSKSSIESLVKPLKEALNKTEQQIKTIEKERKEDFGSIKQYLETVTRDQQQLQIETSRLVQAFKKPHARGRWGELTLHRTVELAGMVEHCDFEEQSQKIDDEGQRLRPDMIIHLPNERQVVVDAKTSLDAYLASIEAEDEKQRNEQLQRHAQQIAAHVKGLASKNYWQQFSDSLDFVVMFLPGEQFLTSALERDPTLYEEAMKKKVIIATPPTLVALLRAIAYGWRQKSFEENAQKIQQLGEELYTRIATFTEHLARVGKDLNNSVSDYNKAVGSLETNLLSKAKKFTALGIQQKKEIPEVPPLEITARELTSNTSKNEN